MPKSSGQFAEALTTLPSMLKSLITAFKPINIKLRDDPTYCLNLEEKPDVNLGIMI